MLPSPGRRTGRSSIVTRSYRRRGPDLGRVLGSASSPFRHAAARPDRDLVLVNLIGVVAVAAGLVLLTGSSSGFTLEGAVNGILSQSGTTLPAAVSVFLATCMNLGAGAVLVRIVRWTPFASFGELALSGLVGAILLDAFLLFTLGSIGWFRPLPLALVNLGILAASPVVQPWLVPGEHRVPRVGLLAWTLVGLVWIAPLLLQLASPVVPFIDVLPNHVAPVQHLETYGTWESLAVNPSPIYGASRLFLGYVSLLGSLSVLTSRSAALVVAAFALPLTILLALATSHLASVLAAPTEEPTVGAAEAGRPSAGYWALLTMPLTFVFLRLPDARDGVLVFPLVAFALAVLVGRERWGGRSQAMILAATISAASYVHPEIGAFLGATVGIVAVLSPSRLRLAFAGLIGAAIVALPQLGVVAGVAAPAWAALPAIPVGLIVAAWLSGPVRRDPSSGPRAPALEVGWRLLALGLVAAVAAVAAAGVIIVALPHAAIGLAGAATTSIVDYGVLLLPGALAVLLVRSTDAWRVIGAGLIVGGIAICAGMNWPGDSLTAQSIRYEVPKAVGYWAPWFVAIGGGLGLGALWDRRGWPPVLRLGLAAGFVVLAAVDLQPAGLEAVGIEQHRYADSLAIVLHEAETGYWVGYPDPRTIVDSHRRDLLAAVQAEQNAGRMGPSSTVLHVAQSFQQWVATPLGVFAGVIETDATPDPEYSLHTAGGRLMNINTLGALLHQGFDYVVVEGMPDQAANVSEAEAAGYRMVWQDGFAALLRR